MVVLFVDTEHDRVRGHPRRGPAHRAKVEASTALLATLSGEPCRSRTYDAVDLDGVARIAPSAIVIGGNTTAWARFDPTALAGLLGVLRAAPVPILGVCAGHQLIGHAHGAAWGPLGALHLGEPDPDPRFAPGQRKERGFLPVALDRRCPLFAGLEPEIAVFQSHSWHLLEVPNGFLRRAGSAWAAIQAIERRDRPIFGVQFHPERADRIHPAGRDVLRNFFAQARAWTTNR